MTTTPRTPLGKRIRALRTEQHMNPEQLAVKSGVRMGTLTRIERGETQDPLWSTMVAIAQALDTSLDWLAYGDEDAATA